MDIFFRFSKKRLALPFICLMLFLLVGCMAHFGKYKTSRDAGKIFESYQVLPDHNYYFTGPESRPGAILAIHKRYVLTSADLWTQKDVNTNDLKNWVAAMNADFYLRPYGFYIVEPDGKKIGLFFSFWDRGPVVLEGDNRVSVYLPDRVNDFRPPKSD